MSMAQLCPWHSYVHGTVMAKYAAAYPKYAQSQYLNG